MRINLGVESVRFPNGLAARFQALQMMDRAMALVDAARIELCLLKLTIDVAGKDAVAMQHSFTPMLQQAKT